MLQEVTDVNFADRVLTSDKPVLVEFWATWCGPCRMVGPVLERLADEHPEIGIVKMDLDANPATARNYQVMAAPTMLLFEGGEVVKTIVGAKPKAALERELFQPVG
ncbi:thioredoxin [Kutzneria kofuensis]|uniref:Thioredoxin n=1 Tax=Kutzneria kofuensis TaxID=103725 RepID=A0A7W9KH78_9PSEU|nr:thioredoxin [Kutzneria kofuensis]MBB5892558.1 thioredoxin 1 [Kutzneria kofuensis]